MEEAHDHNKRDTFTRSSSQELLNRQQHHATAKLGNGFDRRPVAPDLDFYGQPAPQQRGGKSAAGAAGAAAEARARESAAAAAAAATDLDYDGSGDWALGAAGVSTDLDGNGGVNAIAGETDLDSLQDKDKDSSDALNDSTNLDSDDDDDDNEAAPETGMRRRFSMTKLADAATSTANSKVGMSDYAKRIFAEFEAAGFRCKNPRNLTAAQRSHILKVAKQKAEAYIRSHAEHDAEVKRVREEESLLSDRTDLHRKDMKSAAPVVVPVAANPRISEHSWQVSPHISSPPPAW